MQIEESSTVDGCYLHNNYAGKADAICQYLEVERGGNSHSGVKRSSQ